MRLDWRKGILYVTAAGIELIWFHGLFFLLNDRLAVGRLSEFGFLLIYPLSAAINTLLHRLRWHRTYLLTISWILWAVSMLLVTKFQLFPTTAWSDNAWLLAVPRAFAGIIHGFDPELVVILATGVIWWLGRRLTYLKIDFAALFSEFQFGLFIMVITFFSASRFEVYIPHPVYLIMAFFLLSLLGISVAHAMEGTSWLSGLNQGHWSGLLLITIALILILGFVISLLVTPDLIQLFLNAIKWVWNLLDKALMFLINLIPAPEPSEVPPLPPATTPGFEPDEGFTFALPETLRNVIRAGWIVLVLGIIVLALWRVSSEILRWLNRRLAGMAGAELEPLPGAFRADFIGLLRHFISRIFGLGRLFRRRERAKPASPEISAARQVYRHFLNWAASAGFPRHVFQTPDEFCHELAGRLPAVSDDLALISTYYAKARYGGWQPGEDDLNRMRESWSNIKQHRPEGRR